MNGMRKSILTATLTLAVGILFAGSALALTWPASSALNGAGSMADYLTSLGVQSATYTGGALSGEYAITPLATEAEFNIYFKDSSGSLFYNKNTQSDFGVTKTADMGSAYFYEANTRTSTGVNALHTSPYSDIKILELTSAWTLGNGKILGIGTLLLGLNDSSTGDKDYDDFILAASKSAAPTPVPGAVWLLGSGLLGIMGFKRTRKTEQAKA